MRPFASVLRGRRRIYYGWWLILGSMVAVGILSGIAIWSFTLFVEPLEVEFGWSRAQVVLGASLAALTGGVSSPFVGRWVDAQGPRRVILVGVVLSVLSLILLSTTSALWQWYLYNGVFGVGIAASYFIPFQALASRWFDRRRGMAIGLLGVGIALGGLGIVLAMRVVIDAFDWRGGFLFGAALMGAYMVPLTLWLLRDRPSDVGARIDGQQVRTDEARRAVPLTGVALSHALRTPLFWTLTLAIGLFFFGAFGWVVHAVPYYESRGIGTGLAAGLVAISLAVGAGARLAGGWIVDRSQSFERLAMGMAVLGGLAMLSLLTLPGFVGVGLFIFLWACSNVGPFMLEPVAMSRAFGVRHFATIIGVVTVLRTALQLLGPLVAGIIFDSTGKYDWALITFIVIFGVAAALFYVAARLRRPDFPPALGEGAPQHR